jgi:hypothetical protein
MPTALLAWESAAWAVVACCVLFARGSSLTLLLLLLLLLLASYCKTLLRLQICPLELPKQQLMQQSQHTLSCFVATCTVHGVCAGTCVKDGAAAATSSSRRTNLVELLPRAERTTSCVLVRKR